MLVLIRDEKKVNESVGGEVLWQMKSAKGGKRECSKGSLDVQIQKQVITNVKEVIQICGNESG